MDDSALRHSPDLLLYRSRSKLLYQRMNQEFVPAANGLAGDSNDEAAIEGLREVGTMTQIEMARQGTISREMEHVARREGLDPELVRSEVARGRMIIPANTVHLKLGLEPMGIGIKAKCKINANIGNSAVTSDVDNELVQAQDGRRARLRHRDGPLDRRQHRRDPPGDHRRQPGAGRHGADLPGDPAGQEGRGPLRARTCSTWSSTRPSKGVDYMTIHAGILRDYIPLTAHRITGIVSRGGSLMAQWMFARKPGEPVLHALRRSVRHHAGVRRLVQPGRQPAPGLASPTPPTRPSSPSSRRWAS